MWTSVLDIDLLNCEKVNGQSWLFIQRLYITYQIYLVYNDILTEENNYKYGPAYSFMLIWLGKNSASGLLGVGTWSNFAIMEACF